MDEEAGQAILGTPYGQALATMLIQHKNAFEGMNIKSVTVCDTQESGGRPDLWFELTGPTTPSPTLNSATPAEQSVRTSNKPNTFDEYLRIGKLLLDHMKPGSHLPEDPQEMRASDIDMWVVDGLNVPFGYKWTKSDYNVHKGEFKTFVRLIPFQKISDSPKDLMGSFNGGYSVWKGGCEQEGIDPTTMKYLSLWTGSEKDIIPKILDHSRLSNKDIPYEGGHDFGMDTKTGQAMLGAYPHVGDLVLRHFPTKTIEAVKIYWTPKGEHLDCWFILADKEPPHPTQPSSPPLSFQKIELKP